MRKIIFALLFVYAALPAHSSAPAIKKADAVAVQKKEVGGVMESNSLVPTALGLVSGVMQLNQQMKTLTGECIPTRAELDFVSNMMKEQAKAGKDFSSFWKGNRTRCDSGGNSFKNSAEMAANTKGISPCVAVWNNSTADKGMIWQDVPKASEAKICKKNGGVNCTAKDEESVSDIYEIFGLIEFGPSDYLPGEAALAAKLIEKNDRCSDAKLNAKKREMWGGFIMQTAGGLGQKQDLGGVMGTVSGIMQQGGGNNMQTIMGLGGALTQGLMK